MLYLIKEQIKNILVLDLKLDSESVFFEKSQYALLPQALILSTPAEIGEAWHYESYRQDKDLNTKVVKRKYNVEQKLTVEISFESEKDMSDAVQKFLEVLPKKLVCNDQVVEFKPVKIDYLERSGSLDPHKALVEISCIYAVYQRKEYAPILDVSVSVGGFKG